ncbi:MAG: pilus assembly protein [Pirellulaceae bacterium]|nr:pilus assembly protein [Pirellulaceae bacterium]
MRQLILPKLPSRGGHVSDSQYRNVDSRLEDCFKVEKVSRSCRKQRRGAAAVEFAIVAPVFFLMILGMIEIGRAVMVQQVITNASREGARMAVLPGATIGDIETRVDNILSSQTISGATVQILDENGSATDPQNAAYGDILQVRVSVPFSEVSWLPASKFLGGRTLSAATVMRTERVQ